MRLRNCRGSFDVFLFFLVKKVCFKVVSHISRSEFITHSSILPIKILFLASMSSFCPCIMAVHQHVPCALSLWLVCLAHCILHRTFSIGLVFMATESPKMLVYYIPVSLNYSRCKYSSFFYFRYCFSVAQSSDFYCPNRAVPTTYYRLKIQRKFCLNLWVLFKCVFD